jgi:hypothetical protein
MAATPTTAKTDIALQESLDGKNVEWMEKVSDEQYRRWVQDSAANVEPERFARKVTGSPLAKSF